MRRLIAILWLGMLSLLGASAEAATPFERGLQAESELRIDEARDLFRQALAENPDTPGVAEHTAWFLFLNGFQDEECRDLMRRAAQTAQEPAAMERAARFIERKLGQRGPADAEEQEATKMFHDLMIKRAAEGGDEQMGGALVDAGDFEKGIPLLEKALAADPTNGSLSLRLARAHVWSQQLPEADAAYEKLLAQYPDNLTLLLEGSQVAAGRGNIERAETLLAAAEKARPEDPRIARERANVEVKQAELAAAAKQKPVAAPPEKEKMAAALPKKLPEKPAEQAAAAQPEQLPAPKELPAVDTAYARGEKAEKQLRI